MDADCLGDHGHTDAKHVCIRGSNVAKIAVTGSASGIGAATVQALRSAGFDVLSVDLRNADIQGDLSSASGRAAVVAEVLSQSGGVLDGVVLCAGLGPQHPRAEGVAQVNYFGVTELLDGLKPALEKGQGRAAVVVSSVASVHLGWEQNPLGAALESGDHGAVSTILEGAGARAGQLAYAGSKNAVTVAVRRRAADWGALGLRLNTVAPGAVETPLLQAGLADPRFGKAIESFVAPIARRAAPAEIASAILFLMGPGASFVHGTQLFVDGGIDAATRPTRF